MRTTALGGMNLIARLFLTAACFATGIAHATPIYPNVADRKTLRLIAIMANNAYYEHDHRSYFSRVDGFEEVHKFGKLSGLSGYAYKARDAPVVVIAYRGSSSNLISEYERVLDDQYMDNLLFSCCCATGNGKNIRPVCSCLEGRKKCNARCLQAAVRKSAGHYFDAVQIFRKISSDYPNCSIWLTGHSLGGALANLVAIQHAGLASVAFSSPGERLAAQRLQLQSAYDDADVRREFGVGPEEHPPIWNFGFSTDPVFNGESAHRFSICAMAGYALETQCRSGVVCPVDTFFQFKTIVEHSSKRFIRMLSRPGKPIKCYIPGPCTDCAGWTFA